MLIAGKHYIIFFYVLVYVGLHFNLPILAQNKNTVLTQFPEPIFEHLTVEDGLPENSVRCILQDHFGYMWFGTQNGLVKYDGYNMTVYQPDLEDSLSISDRTVNRIYEDRSGALWIGTNGGLNRFDRITETFTKYMHDTDDSASLSNNIVTSIEEDKNGNIFVGTYEGLNLFDRLNENFKHIYFQDSLKSAILNYKVGTIIEDRLTGRLYVGSGNKILVYDSENELLTRSLNNFAIDFNLGVIRSFYQSSLMTFRI